MELIDKDLEFEMEKKGRVLILEIELVGMCNKLMSELLVDDLSDIWFIETVFKWALITECKTMITFVMKEYVGLIMNLLLTKWF